MAIQENQRFEFFRVLGKNASIFALGDFFSKGILFLSIPYITSKLSAEDYGLLGVISPIYLLLSGIFSMQISGALSSLYYRVNVEKRKELIATVWLIVFIFSLSFYFVVSIIDESWWGSLLPNIPYDPFVRITIFIAYLMVFPATYKSVIVLMKRPWTYLVFSIFTNLLYFLFLFIFLERKFADARGVLLALVLSNLFAFCFASISLARTFKFPRKLRFEFGRQLVVLALPLLPHMISHLMLNNSDRLILQYYLDLDQVAIYQLGYQVGMILQVIVIATNLAWTPIFLQRVEDRNNWMNIRWGVTVLLIIQACLGLFLIIFRSEIIRVLSNEIYLPSAYIIPWVVTGYFFVGVYNFFVNILFYKKKTRYIPVATVAAVIFNIIANILFIPRFGIVSAAIITTASYLILLMITFYFSRKVMEFPFDYSRMVKIIVWFLIVGGLSLLIPCETNYWVIVKGALFLSFPLIIYLSKIFGKAELERLPELVKK